MIDRDFDSGDDGLSPILNIRFESAKLDGRDMPDPGLVFVAAKVLHRVKGDLKRPHGTLLFRDSNELTGLGAGLVVYAALTIATLPDERFFQTGHLLELGQTLAEKVRLPTWDAFLRENYPTIAGKVGIQVELSPLYPGSFAFFQRLVVVISGVASVSGLLSTADTAYVKTRDIYLPLAAQALDASQDYAQRYAEGLRHLLNADVETRIPPLPAADRLPELFNPPRIRAADEE